MYHKSRKNSGILKTRVKSENPFVRRQETKMQNYKINSKTLKISPKSTSLNNHD